MCRFQVRPPSYPELAKSIALPTEHCSVPTPPVAPGLAWISRPVAMSRILSFLMFCLLFLTISGCGGISIVRGTGAGTLVASPNPVSFGAVSVNQTASNTVLLSNGGTEPVEITQLSLTGKSFSIVAQGNLPLVIAGGGTYGLSVQFNPSAEGAATDLLTISSTAFPGGSAAVSLSGKGTAATSAPAAALSALSCTNPSFTGSGIDACTVTLTSAAPSGGLSVSLSSNDAAVSVPATVTVPANATSAGFTAMVASVATAQAVTLTATSGSVSKSFALQLNAAVPTLAISTTSVVFGDVQVNTASTQSIVLKSTGTAPVTVHSAILTGADFTATGATFPTTLNPGQTVTLNVQFRPTTVGVASGQLGISSNSSAGATAVIGLYGTGIAAPPVLSGFSCNSNSMTGSGTDSCAVTLASAAPAGGLKVSLSSSNAAVSVPVTATVPAKATSAGFTATVSAVTTAQTVTLTATSGSISKSFVLKLNAAVPTLTINASSVAFGNVEEGTVATQSVTLTSTGTAPVTVNSATLTGAGFSLSGASFPVTLNPGQALTLNLQFDPTTAGAATGQLTIASNSSVGPSALIALSGTGLAPITVNVSPVSVVVATGASQQFKAAVAGTTNTAVTWSVAGVGCTGADCGTISSGGLYTAPAVIPSPAAVAVTATSKASPSVSSTAEVTIILPVGTTYYLAPVQNGGNDSNSGLSPDKPWLSPNHPVNCGDVIIAEASDLYIGWNFEFDWGVVTCPAKNNVAWLKCATFDACKVVENNTGSFTVDHSYWGVEGFEVDASPGSQDIGCFTAAPNYANPVEIHHIVFANNIANGCQSGGFGSFNQNAQASVDYLAIIGNIAYNAAQSSRECYSGISIYQPIESDTLPGTHIYVAGNFSWGNVEPASCASAKPTDGEGIIFDTFDGHHGNLPSPYSGQAVADNNMLLVNGGRGLEIGGNNVGIPPFATIYARNNTMWGNNLDKNQDISYCGEFSIDAASNVLAYSNLSVTNSPDGCGNHPIYAYYVAESPTTTDSVSKNWGYAASGTNAGEASSNGFSYSSNNSFGTNPNFANPVAPAAPSCGNYSSVPDCMKAVVTNFTPKNEAAANFGYQVPSTTPIYDPLFPRWLCNVKLPEGLVTPGCLSAQE